MENWGMGVFNLKLKNLPWNWSLKSRIILADLYPFLSPLNWSGHCEGWGFHGINWQIWTRLYFLTRDPLQIKNLASYEFSRFSCSNSSIITTLLIDWLVHSFIHCVKFSFWILTKPYQIIQNSNFVILIKIFILLKL